MRNVAMGYILSCSVNQCPGELADIAKMLTQLGELIRPLTEATVGHLIRAGTKQCGASGHAVPPKQYQNEIVHAEVGIFSRRAFSVS